MTDFRRKSNSYDSRRPSAPSSSDFGISPNQLNDVLNYFRENSIRVSDFLHTLFTYAVDCAQDFHNETLHDLEKKTGHILSQALSHPRLTVPVLQWVHTTAVSVYKREVRTLTEAGTGWHFTASKANASKFSDFSMATIISTTAARAPLLWDLCDSLFSVDGKQSGHPDSKATEIQFRLDVKKMACIANIAHANNQRCNLLQVVVGIFLHTCNSPERAIDLFARLGMSCSQQSILGAIDSLSKECTRHIRDAGQSLVVSYAYDNFDMTDKSKTHTVEESTDCLRHLTSGTLLPLHFTNLEDLTSARAFWGKSRFNDMRVVGPPSWTWDDLFTLHPETLDDRGMGRQDRFKSWQFQKDLLDHGPLYFRKFQAKLSLPEFVDKVPLFRTRQVPARAMDLPNSSVDGNIATIESLFRQGGVFDSNGLANRHPTLGDVDDLFVLFHGDLGTGERIQTAQYRRSLEATPMRRLQCVVFIPGLFHIKMACADALWRIFLQPAAARSDDTSLFAFITALRPGETSKIANGTAGYQILNECITHVGRVERLAWWERVIQEKVPGCFTLEDFAQRQPSFDTVVEYANILSSYVSPQHIETLQAALPDRRDRQLENAVHRSVLFLLYEETAHAIRSGDVGRVETCIMEWIPIFKAVGKHKYSSMLLQFLTDVHYEYPKPLKQVIRRNWFCNPSGKEMKYQGVDWLVELNNMLTKTIYGGQGANNTVERVIKESVLIQLFRDIICIMEQQFGLSPKLTRHGEPDMTATYKEMMRMMKERGTLMHRPGRKTAHVIRDAFEDGVARLATENIAQITAILENSLETEIIATEEDIIMEVV